MQPNKILATLLGLLLALLASTALADSHPRPYCSGAAAGNCQFSWEWDNDINTNQIWIYDRNCNQLAYMWNPPYNTIFTLQVPGWPWAITIRYDKDGPNFVYDATPYYKQNCWHYEGEFAWKDAGQCAFNCPA